VTGVGNTQKLTAVATTVDAMNQIQTNTPGGRSRFDLINTFLIEVGSRIAIEIPF
jgi:hypothetical protein